MAKALPVRGVSTGAADHRRAGRQTRRRARVGGVCGFGGFNFIKFAKGKVVEIPVSASNGFQYSAAEIVKRINANTKAIFISQITSSTGLISTTLMSPPYSGKSNKIVVASL